MSSILDQDYQFIRSNSSNFTYSFTNFDISSRFTHCVITSLSIPKTFYVLPEDATLVVSENGIDFFVTIEKGNYRAIAPGNNDSFATYLATKINAACNYTYAVSYQTNPELGKYTFTVTGNGGDQPNFLPENQYLAEMMGLPLNTVSNFVGDTLQSTNTINFQVFDKLLVKCDMVRNKASLLQDIVTSNVPYNASISYYNSGDLWLNAKLLKPMASDTFNFSLVNINNELVSLNGNYWSFVIKFFRVGDLFNVISKEIRLRRLEEDEKMIDETAF